MLGRITITIWHQAQSFAQSTEGGANARTENILFFYYFYYSYYTYCSYYSCCKTRQLKIIYVLSQLSRSIWYSIYATYICHKCYTTYTNTTYATYFPITPITPIAPITPVAHISPIPDSRLQSILQFGHQLRERLHNHYRLSIMGVTPVSRPQAILQCDSFTSFFIKLGIHQVQQLRLPKCAHHCH